MWLKRIQLGLIHMAIAMTLVPINGVLNRIMIKELAISATIVALLVSLPYLLSPIQVAIGSFSDRHPILGRRRVPYVWLGLLMCVAGSLAAPYVAFDLTALTAANILKGALVFGLWGMGYNLSAVCYLSLASELDENRSATIATMFLIMITGIIGTSITVGRMVDPYTEQALLRAFWVVGGLATVLGILGLIGLEKPMPKDAAIIPSERHSWLAMSRVVIGNRQARIFFIYLLLLLAALLGQDVLLEPYAAEAFGLPPSTTTYITSIWGTCMLVTLALSNPIQRKTSKMTVVLIGNWGALIGFGMIAFSGIIHSATVFYVGVVVFGLGTGFSTVSNLSLMLDMTTPESAGLYIGAWGVANALSRLTGQVLSGALRDVVAGLTRSAITGYVVVFVVLTAFIGISLILLRWVNTAEFRTQAEGIQTGETFADSVALMHEAQGG